MPDLIEQAQQSGLHIDEVIADKAYGTSTNLQLLEKKEIQATIKLHPAVYGQSSEHRDKFINHKDSDTVECPAGHHSTRKIKNNRKDGGRSPRIIFYFI